MHVNGNVKVHFDNAGRYTESQLERDCTFWSTILFCKEKFTRKTEKVDIRLL